MFYMFVFFLSYLYVFHTLHIAGYYVPALFQRLGAFGCCFQCPSSLNLYHPWGASEADAFEADHFLGVDDGYVASTGQHKDGLLEVSTSACGGQTSSNSGKP